MRGEGAEEEQEDEEEDEEDYEEEEDHQDEEVGREEGGGNALRAPSWIPGAKFVGTTFLATPRSVPWVLPGRCPKLALANICPMFVRSWPNLADLNCGRMWTNHGPTDHVWNISAKLGRIWGHVDRI